MNNFDCKGATIFLQINNDFTSKFYNYMVQTFEY